jgi:hypothetical protein
MEWRSCVVLSLGCALAAACASATTQQQNSTNPDASKGHNDGKQTDASLIDASLIDAPDGPSGACAMPFTGVLATWSFTGATGSQTSTPASSTAPGVVAGAISRASSLTASSGSGSINSSNWATSATLDTSKYYTFTVAPPSGCAMDLSSLAIDAKSSSTGPTKAAVATDADSYATQATVSTSAASTPALSVNGASGMVEVRVFGYSASSASGTMRVQNTLTISGALH